MIIFFQWPKQNYYLYMNIELTQAIQDLVDSIADIYRQNLESSKATGNLQNFQTHITLNDTTFSVGFELEDYWKYVEYGRRPGKQPPIEAIENWVRVKPIVPDSRTDKVPNTKQLAYLIARKIGREGTPAQKPLTNTMYSEEVNILISAIKNNIVEQVYKYITSDEISD